MKKVPIKLVVFLMQFHLSVMQERKFKEKRETKIKALMKIKTCNK